MIFVKYVLLHLWENLPYSIKRRIYAQAHKQLPNTLKELVKNNLCLMIIDFINILFELYNEEKYKYNIDYNNMAGGLFPNYPFELNPKCVIFSIIIMAGTHNSIYNTLKSSHSFVEASTDDSIKETERLIANALIGGDINIFNSGK